MRTVPATVSTGLRLIAGQPTLLRITVLIASVGVALATVELLTPLTLAGLLGGEQDAAGPYAAILTLSFSDRQRAPRSPPPPAAYCDQRIE